MSMSMSMSVLRVKTVVACLLVLPALLAARPSRADEGMWSLNNLPRQLLKERYGFSPDARWLEHVRLASVRFQDGGSGAFVSGQGLVLTNHHVAVGQLQKMSSAKKDYVRDGYHAARREQEIPCVDLSVMVLASMEEVTQRVLDAAGKESTPERALKARKAAQAAVETESRSRTGLHSEVVSLYQGGEYWLHRYRKYTDVRLVMAPEKQSAFFGGDEDNFTYPRHDLDIAFFRLYEGGKPLASRHYFPINPRAGKSGELVFVSGHPASTERQLTLADLELLREVTLPTRLLSMRRLHAALTRYAARGAEPRRQANTRLFGLSNGIKALDGELRALGDPAITAAKREEQSRLQRAVASRPAWEKEYGGLWRTIEGTAALRRKLWPRAVYQDLRMGSMLARIATNLVLLVAELKKPDGERMQGFHESELDELKQRLFSRAPIYPEMEAATLTAWFELCIEKLGKDDPLVKAITAMGSPAGAAARLVSTTLIAPAVRRQLAEGGAAAVEAFRDPLLVFARGVAPLIQANEKLRKKRVDSVLIPAREALARARFAVYGRSVYPDATFTLRLTFGRIEGYPMNGTLAPPRTTLHGLYDRALGFDQKRSFWLPARFWTRKDRLDLSTPVNFVSTCDIIGGNSGSPTINRQAELVGVVFDGNIESLAGAFVYDGTANRAVSVHAAYIMEAIDKLYDARELARELRGEAAPR